MALVCAISGELPQVPVVSRKSGSVYEKRLIEAYISENGTEPATGADLTVEDLLDIQSTRNVRPRPPELTSIPALLNVFQQEWDTLALEVYTLQQNLVQARQELSTALYQQDAAIRVIARLTQERDAARDALKTINMNGSMTTNGDVMHAHPTPLPDSIKEKIQHTQAELMKTRRKRPVPAEWATSETISVFKVARTTSIPGVKASFVSTTVKDDTVLVGTGASNIAVVTRDATEPLMIEAGSSPVTAGAWNGTKFVIGTAYGSVQLYNDQTLLSSFDIHSGPVTGLSVHASGEVLASCSRDKTYSLFDLQTKSLLTQVPTGTELTCTSFHPDGNLLGVGSTDGSIQIYDVSSSTLAGSFEIGGPISAICFAENGTMLAASSSNSSTISILDLRKTGPQAVIHVLDNGGRVSSLDWDYTAQFLLASGLDGISVHQYTKANKMWSQVYKTDLAVEVAAWGESAQSIICLGQAGTSEGEGLLLSTLSSV